MPDPESKARWVLATQKIAGIPALALLDIARRESIKVHQEPFPEEPDFGGELLFKGPKKAIIVNTVIKSPRRHTFTLAHELGHYFLAHAPTYKQDDASGILCTVDDIRKGHRPVEWEANRFATALLMPETSFRPLTAGAPLDFTLIDSLAREFQVSKHACSNRILDFTREPYAVINSKGFTVTACKLSRAAGGYIYGLKKIPEGTAAHAAIFAKRNQHSFTECDPQLWQTKSGSGLKLYEWTRGRFDNGVAMTILRWQGA